MPDPLFKIEGVDDLFKSIIKSKGKIKVSMYDSSTKIYAIDTDCNLCIGSGNFLYNNGGKDANIKYIALNDLLDSYPLLNDERPDGVGYLEHNSSVYWSAEAVINGLSHVEKWWSNLLKGWYNIPLIGKTTTNIGYNIIAKLRYFTKKGECENGMCKYHH